MMYKLQLNQDWMKLAALFVLSYLFAVAKGTNTTATLSTTPTRTTYDPNEFAVVRPSKSDNPATEAVRSFHFRS